MEYPLKDSIRSLMCDTVGAGEGRFICLGAAFMLRIHQRFLTL